MAHATLTAAHAAPAPALASLGALAQQLRAAARQQGQARLELPDGLCIALYRRGDLWALVLYRDDVPPSEDAIMACRLAFGVPATADALTTHRLTSLVWRASLTAPDPPAQPPLFDPVTL